MTVNDLINTLDLEPLSLADGDREISGAYAGDLLSWVMGRACEGNVWVTIMTNINTVAVASLADVACVIFAENCEPDEGVVETALAKGVNLLRSPLKTYELCVALGKVI